jgi:hypothetical protein
VGTVLDRDGDQYARHLWAPRCETLRTRRPGLSGRWRRSYFNSSRRSRRDVMAMPMTLMTPR